MRMSREKEEMPLTTGVSVTQLTAREHSNNKEEEKVVEKRQGEHRFQSTDIRPRLMEKTAQRLRSTSLSTTESRRKRTQHPGTKTERIISGLTAEVTGVMDDRNQENFIDFTDNNIANWDRNGCHWS